MRWLITAALFLVMLTAQQAAGPHLHVLGATPDFLVIFVVQIALVLPPFDAILWSWGMGLAADLYGDTPVGVLAVTYALVALVITRIRGQIFAAHILTRLTLVLIADVLQHLVLLFSQIIRGHPIPFLLSLRTAALDVLYTVVFALVLLPTLSFVLGRLYPERRRT